MKFTLEQSSRINAVTARSAGEVRVGERVFTSSVIVTADALIPEWAATDAEALSLGSLEAALALKPEILILGTGERQVFPEPRLFAAVTGRGIGFEVMDNGAACRTYNVLVAEGRNVVLALIL